VGCGGRILAGRRPVCHAPPSPAVPGQLLPSARGAKIARKQTESSHGQSEEPRVWCRRGAQVFRGTLWSLEGKL